MTDVASTCEATPSCQEPATHVYGGLSPRPMLLCDEHARMMRDAGLRGEIQPWPGARQVSGGEPKGGRE